MPSRHTRLGAYGVLCDGDAALLVRASALDHWPGVWYLPGGGVEFGEHPEQAVVRELAEETGLVVEVAGSPRILADVATLPEDGSEEHSVRIVYPLVVRGGELRPEPEGTSDMVAWVTRGEAAGLRLHPYARTALGWDDGPGKPGPPAAG